MRIAHPHITVFTGETWLMNAFQNYTSPSGRSIIFIEIDPDGDPIIGKSIASDPTWNLQIPVTNPYTQETRPLIGWLSEKPYIYNEETE